MLRKQAIGLDWFRELRDQSVVFVVCLYQYAKKISILALFSLDIFSIQYWELLLAWPFVLDHTPMNRVSQMAIFIFPNHLQKIISTPQLSIEI